MAIEAGTVMALAEVTTAKAEVKPTTTEVQNAAATAATEVS